MFEQFLEAYVEAILFTENCLRHEIECYKDEIVQDCRNFWGTYHDYIDCNARQAGHDFWLTRNRHGAGFWDGDWPVHSAKILTDASHQFGPMSLIELLL